MSKLITHIKRVALALCLATPIVSWAATPVAVWDGDFNATQTGFSLQLSGNDLSGDGSTITIDQDVGVKVDFTTGVNAMTVMFKYSGLTFDAQKTLATSFCSGGDENRTGVYAAKGGTINGIWNTANWNNPSEILSESSGVLAFCYHKGNGTSLYYINTDGSRIELFNKSGLRASDDTAINGCTIGGERAKSGATLLGAATDMKITALAIFNGILTESDMTGYVWPSEIETVSVDADTTVTAINALIAGVDESSKKVVVDVADGVTIDVDTAFEASKPTTIASEGNVTLSAETQPDASYFSAVDFDVKGALLRSWLTPGVVGFNFYKNRGNDTTDALATGTWYSDANSKTGTSTALFSDGLSVLSWNCSTLYSQGGYYDQTGEEGTLLNGYLDDGSLNGNGAEVYLSNVPYETYDVIIYAASDTATANFLAKTVNGTTYTWDTATGSAVEGNAAWGKAALNTPVYGVNTLRIKNLTGALTIYGTAKTGTPRGGISAIQIMPPETPDNVRLYKLTLDGTATNWSAGTWTLNDQAVEAPTAGYVEIVASASTEVTVDTAVSIASLTINGSEDVVVSIVTDGEEGSSFSTIGATVAGGVFKQGVANSVTGLVTVENGGTFDMNGLANGAALVIAGAGAGNWPWALGSSSGEVQLSTPPTLTGDAAIGGAGKIVLGSSAATTPFELGGFTLTKSGSGELYCYNVRTDNGTIDIAGGTLSFNQWTALDGSETIDRHTTVIVRNGAELKNNAGRRLWIDTLNVEAGATVTTTANGYFGVSSAFNGTCDTTKLQFNDGAVATLDGNLTLATLVAQGDNSHTTVGSISLALADGTSAATVTVSDTVSAVGTIAVGAGVTPAFTGEGDVTATLSYAADPSPTANTALAFTQESNWKGTVVLDYAITGVANGSVFQPGKYGNANSTVCLGQGATNVFLSVRGSTNPGNIDTKLYLKGDLSLRNGWGTDSKITTIPQLGADEGITLRTRQGANSSNGTTYYDITALKDFAGTIALSDRTDVTVGNVVLDALPEKGALVVKATRSNTDVKGTISGSVTVGEETVQLEYGTVGEETGLYRPVTVDITVTAVEHATASVTVNGVSVTPDEGVITVKVGDEVSVTYTADDGYVVTGSPVEFTATADTTSVDTTGVTTKAYVAWIYDENGDLVGNPYTDEMTAVGAFLQLGTGESIRFLAQSTFHDMLLAACTYDEETFTYTRKPAEPTVATITIGEKVYEYTSLAAAVAEGQNATIVLVDDIDLTGENGNVTVPATKNDAAFVTTLDLNGHSIAGDNDGDITVLGTLTLKDTVENSEGRIYSTTDYATGHETGLVLVQESGVFNMQSGAIYAVRETPAAYGQFAVIVAGNGTVNVSGGTITAGWYAIGANNQQGSAMSVNITGGTLVSTTDYALYVVGNMTVNISGTAAVSGAAGMAGVRNGSLNITGGTFATSGDGDVGSWTDGTATLSPTKALINLMADYAVSSVTISGGTFTAASSANCFSFGAKAKEGSSIVVTGGSFSSDPSDYVATGYEATEEDGVWTVSAIPAYAVTLNDDDEHISLSVNPSSPVAKGATVVVTVVVDDGYIVDEVEYAGITKDDVTEDEDEGTITFTMPNNAVTVTVTSKVPKTPVTPGAQTEPVETAEAAEAEAAKVVPSVPTAVAEALSDEQETAYKSLFEPKVVEVKDGETTKYAVEVALTQAAETAIKEEIAPTELTTGTGEEEKPLDVASLATATDDTEVNVTTKPGIYYGVKAGSSLGDLTVRSCKMATSNSDTVTFPKAASTDKAMFWVIFASPTPVAVPSND